MAHTRADTGARQSALDGLFQSINKLDAAVAEAEARELRMTAADGANRQSTVERFDAFRTAR